MFMAACERASLAWLIDFTDSAYADYHPRGGKSPQPEENCLTTAADADTLRLKMLERIREAAASGELAAAKNLAYLLFRWRDLARDDGVEVRKWTNVQMDDDATTATFAKAFTSYSWSQSLGIDGLGDAVAKRNTRANVDSLDQILDRAKLRARIEDLARAGTLSVGDGDAVREFLNAWRRHDENSRE
jgi:hypothetical protein